MHYLFIFSNDHSVSQKLSILDRRLYARDMASRPSIFLVSSATLQTSHQPHVHTAYVHIHVTWHAHSSN